MDAGELWQVREVLRQAAEAATDMESARQLREALIESGILAVFSAGASSELLDLLEAGGAEALRARLRGLPLAELRQIIAMRGYDPEKQAARTRSANKLIEVIVARAEEELAAEQATLAQPAPLAAAAWML